MSAPQSAPVDPCIDAARVHKSSGYGVVCIDGKDRRAHRVVWEAHHRPLRPGEVVRHTCDRPPCINPRHLILGTQDDNVRDRDERGRTARGLRNGRAKWSDEQVAEMRARSTQGEPLRHIAAVYGAHPSTVSRIVRGVRRADRPLPG